MNAAFEDIASDLRVKSVDEESLIEVKLIYACVKKQNKYSQIDLASEKKLYLSDYWKDGVCLASGSTDSLNSLVKSIHKWLNADLTIAALADEFEFIWPNDKALYFDENRAVEYAWNEILHNAYQKELKAIVALAMKDKIVGELFPFTSHNILCLSRCTGCPYTYDTPIVVPLSNGTYEVRTADNEIIGSGSSLDAHSIFYYDYNSSRVILDIA